MRVETLKAPFSDITTNGDPENKVKIKWQIY